MEIQEYTRKPFPVGAVQVSLDNIEEVAQWCKGTIEKVPTKMLGTETLLPVIKIQGQGDNRGKEFTATLGCFVVELKGSFRVYKAAQFEASFDLLEKDKTLKPGDENFGHGFLQDALNELLIKDPNLPAETSHTS